MPEPDQFILTVNLTDEGACDIADILRRVADDVEANADWQVYTQLIQGPAPAGPGLQVGPVIGDWKVTG